MKIIYQDDRSKVFHGNSLRSDLNTIFHDNELQIKRAILIIGIEGFTISNDYKQLEDVFKQNKISVLKHLEAKPNPNESRVIRSVSRQKLQFDIIIALGGGSAIDTGKLIKSRQNSNAKLFAIYTLPGSATIVSPFAVFDNNEFKVGIADDDLIPEYSYIYEHFITSLSIERKIVATSDISSHAIESLYSQASSEASRLRSIESLSLLTGHRIERLPSDDFIQADICAGLAERVGLVLFPHAAGHYLTYTLHIPHGIATMYFLPQYLNLLLNKGVKIDSTYTQYVEKLKYMLLDRKMMPKINLSNNDVVELLELTHKYMPFAYENAPVEIAEDEYRKILCEYVQE